MLVPDASRVSELVAELDHLPSQHGAIACAADDGSEILALLAYPGGHDVAIGVGLRGCRMVTNGNVNRLALSTGSSPGRGPEMLAELERLTASG